MAKRIIAVVIILCIMTAILCAPASATVWDAIEYNATFLWEWLTFQKSLWEFDVGEWWKQLLSDGAENAQQNYDDAVQLIIDDVGDINIISENGRVGIRRYMKPTGYSTLYVYDVTYSPYGNTVYISGVYAGYSSSTQFNLNYNENNSEGNFVNDWSAPFYCDYKLGFSIIGDNVQFYNTGLNHAIKEETGTLVKGQKLYNDPTYAPFLRISYNEYGKSQFYAYVQVWVDFFPNDGTLIDYYDVDLTTNSRPTIFNGPVAYIEGDNITIIEQKIVDEQNNQVYLPWLQVYLGFNEWSYDYETRTYLFNFENGDKLKLTYGDEKIIYVYTYYDGTEVEHELYYAVPKDYDDNGGGGNDDGDGKSFIEKLFETIFLGLVEGIIDIFTSLFEFVANIFNSALGMIVSAFSGLWNIISGFLSGIGSSISNFFGMFSSEGGLFDVPLNDGVPVEIPSESTSAPLQVGTFLALLGGIVGALPSELVYIGTAILGIAIIFGIFKLITR